MIEHTVKRIIADQLYLRERDITNDTSLIEDVRADSLDIIELILAFEKEFNISIPDRDISKIKTVQNIIDYLERKKA